MALRQRLVVVLLTATAAVVAIPAAAASPTQRKAAAWSVQAAPQPTLPNGSLLAVACPSAKDCIAVGNALNLHQQQATLAESWNGSNWKLTPTPTPAGSASSGLSGVACISGADCWAVGGYTNAKGVAFTLAELWNGKVWKIKTTANPGRSATLTGVACTAATSCMAVGSSVTKKNFGFNLAERWNGKTWAILTTPRANAVTNSLAAIACSSAKDCVAVGIALIGGGHSELSVALTWNGQAWTLHDPTTPPSQDTGLNDVACPSPTSCVAVGSEGALDDAGTALIEVWNGKTWTASSSPKGVHDLAAVACRSAKSCIAVGGTANRTTTLAEALTGTVWSVQTTPDPPGGTANDLTGVACPTAAGCMAVGDNGDPAGATVTLSETWSTKGWAIRPSADAIGSTTSALGAVSCSSATACTAVGAYDHLVLSETWDGHAWTIRHNPVVAGEPGDSLSGLACRSASQCMAVGAAHLVLTYEGLSESWNGASWTIENVPLPAGTSVSILASVSCPAVKFCEAVGTFQNSVGVEETWAESWNGTRWSLQSTPNPAGSEESQLDSIACPSAISCVAVGDFENASFDNEPVSEAWNGIAWKLLSTPEPTGSPDTSLSSVSCSGTTCMAVGDSTDKAFASSGITEQLVGSHWTIKTPATPTGGSDVTLNGIDCTSAKQCTAVGSYVTRTFAAVPLGEQWTGSKWVLAPMPSPAGSASNVVSAISCSSSTACTAVGATANDTLTERYSG
ncbi:MAG: hypothetical protein ABSE47_14220 [Acidimicrobiales bacterium]|jgi:hypothetical protein